MTISDLSNRASEWLCGIGPMHDVVVSSRVRLARNIAGMPFLSKCDVRQKSDILEKLRVAIMSCDIGVKLTYVDVARATPLDRELLTERHLISKHHASSDWPRGVIISDNETVSLMINEEDHLRMQVLRSGLQLNEAFDEINRIDESLEKVLNYAFSGKYGYLTACPTNVGTGLRVSVMLHLPALKLTGELDRALRAARDMKLAVRGLYGEGTDALGDFFQVSNQLTLGRGEKDIVEEFLSVIVPELLNYERKARQALMTHDAVDIEDKIFRALAILQSSRKITSKETMYRLSMIRLGIHLGKITTPDLKTVNELSLLAQPSHLQKVFGRELSDDERQKVRADFLRQRLGRIQ